MQQGDHDIQSKLDSPAPGLGQIVRLYTVRGVAFRAGIVFMAALVGSGFTLVPILMLLRGGASYSREDWFGTIVIIVLGLAAVVVTVLGVFRALQIGRAVVGAAHLLSGTAGASRTEALFDWLREHWPAGLPSSALWSWSLLGHPWHAKGTYRGRPVLIVLLSHTVPSIDPDSTERSDHTHVVVVGASPPDAAGVERLSSAISRSGYRVASIPMGLCLSRDDNDPKWLAPGQLRWLLDAALDAWTDGDANKREGTIGGGSRD